MAEGHQKGLVGYVLPEKAVPYVKKGLSSLAVLAGLAVGALDSSKRLIGNSIDTAASLRTRSGVKKLLYGNGERPKESGKIPPAAQGELYPALANPGKVAVADIKESLAIGVPVPPKGLDKIIESPEKPVSEATFAEKPVDWEAAGPTARKSSSSSGSSSKKSSRKSNGDHLFMPAPAPKHSQPGGSATLMPLPKPVPALFPGLKEFPVLAGATSDDSSIGDGRSTDASAPSTPRSLAAPQQAQQPERETKGEKRAKKVLRRIKGVFKVT